MPAEGKHCRAGSFEAWNGSYPVRSCEKIAVFRTCETISPRRRKERRDRRVKSLTAFDPHGCLCALYVDSNLDTARLYLNLQSVLGATLAGLFARTSEDGTRRVLGETISHTGYIIMIFQFLVSQGFERRKPIPTFLLGVLIITLGFGVIGYAGVSIPAFVLLGIFLFAVGEMLSSPRIQEYITWIAPREKAGLYTGMHFLAVMLGGALSGVTYTTLYGRFNDMGHPEYVWFALALHTIAGIVLLTIFTRTAGEFREQER